MFVGLQVKTTLYMDSAAARGICKREGVGRTRHLSTKVLWLQQLVKKGVVDVQAIASRDNKADLGTKSLPRQTLVRLRDACGLQVIGDLIDQSDAEEQVVNAVRQGNHMAARNGGEANNVDGATILRAVAGLLTAIRGI